MPSPSWSHQGGAATVRHPPPASRRPRGLAERHAVRNALRRRRTGSRSAHRLLRPVEISGRPAARRRRRAPRRRRGQARHRAPAADASPPAGAAPGSEQLGPSPRAQVERALRDPGDDGDAAWSLRRSVPIGRVTIVMRDVAGQSLRTPPSPPVTPVTEDSRPRQACERQQPSSTGPGWCRRPLPAAGAEECDCHSGAIARIDARGRGDAA